MCNDNLVKTTDKDHVRIITLNHESSQNPFSKNLEDSFKHALKQANNDASVRAIIVTGGEKRSFSAGGDFNEVKNLKGGEDVELWIDRVIDLYITVLQISKPTIAAIDNYAIGMGFQLALMFDWRIASNQAEFRMPELKHGIGCSVGGGILAYSLGFSLMQKIVYECDNISAHSAKEMGIIYEIVNQDQLIDEAIVISKKLSEYPEISFSTTKKAINKSYINTLLELAESSKAVHKASFIDRSNQAHFEKILGKKYYKS